MSPLRLVPSSLTRALRTSKPTQTFHSSHLATPLRPAYTIRTFPSQRSYAATTAPTPDTATPSPTHKGTDGGHPGGDHGHESHYDPPGGWLWGIRPGEKYEKEGWEGVMYWGYALPIVVAVVFYVNKEDTK